MCVFLFCLRRLYENDSGEIKACKPTNIGGGGTKKKISWLENSRMFWEGTRGGGMAAATTELRRKRTRKPRRGRD